MARWPTSIEFVNLAVERLGGGSETTLANVLRLGANGYQKVYRWQNGSKLNYEEAMLILDKLGWLNIDGAAEVARDQGTPDDRLAALEARVESGTDEVARILARLEGAILQLSAQIKREAEPGQKAAP